MKRLVQILGLIFLFVSCSEKKKIYKIYDSIDEPQSSVIKALANTINTQSGDSLVVLEPKESYLAKEDLTDGKVDFAVVDNFPEPNTQLRAVLPIYPQILHILTNAKDVDLPLSHFLIDKKVYAGEMGSTTYNYLIDLVKIYGIDEERVTFLSYIELFEADVIISFTDLLTNDELRDLDGFSIYSLGKVSQLGKGSVAEGLSTRYPEFSPYVLPDDTYGSFTDGPVLTVKTDAILATRADLDRNFVYNLMNLLRENKQSFASINPMINGFSNDFNPDDINFGVHQGSHDYLNRYEPTFLEKYAEVFSVIISIFVAIISTVYTIAQWQKSRKKNKVDVYYAMLIDLREQIPLIESINETISIEREIKRIHKETFDLLIDEKLLADESFTILLNLSKIIKTELTEHEAQLEKEQILA